MKTTVIWVSHWYFVQWRTHNDLQHTLSQWQAKERSDMMQQLCWKHHQPADCWQPSVLDPCSTSSQTFCSYSRRKPKSPQGCSSRQNLDVVQEWKSASCAVWPRFLHTYYQSRMWREWKKGLHCVRVPGNKRIEHNERTVFSLRNRFYSLCVIYTVL